MVPPCLNPPANEAATLRFAQTQKLQAGRLASLKVLSVDRVGPCVGDVGSHLYNVSRWRGGFPGQVPCSTKDRPCYYHSSTSLPTFRFWWFSSLWKILIKYSLEKYLVSIYCVLGTVPASVDRKEGRCVQESLLEEVVPELSLEECVREPGEMIHTDELNWSP